jgi:metal-responsive CopG/Arc/MetJ family transcriptional regulator
MALGKNSMMLQVVVSKDVMAKLDAEREKLGLSRSAFVNVCIASYFRENDAMEMMRNLSNPMFLEMLKNTINFGDDAGE